MYSSGRDLRESEESLLEIGAGDLQVAGGGIAMEQSAASESEQCSRTESPRTSALPTPGRSSSAVASAPGRVALMVRPPTVALISVVGPSATITPWLIRTIRSANESASSR